MDNIKYSQPPFYHFSEDSILLVKEAISFFKNKDHFENVLDLCAGCGVVGIELSLSKKMRSLDFVEIQEAFVTHLKSNLQSHKIQNAKIYNLDFTKFDTSKKYDLILMNPPYFDSAASRLSPNENRNKCRLITKSKAHEILKKVEQSLVNQGYLCIVVPDKSMWGELLTSSALIQLKKIAKAEVNILIFKYEQAL